LGYHTSQSFSVTWDDVSQQLVALQPAGSGLEKRYFAQL